MTLIHKFLYVISMISKNLLFRKNLFETIFTKIDIYISGLRFNDSNIDRQSLVIINIQFFICNSRSRETFQGDEKVNYVESFTFYETFETHV